ncbi:unnamed protein product [Musa textilis]
MKEPPASSSSANLSCIECPLLTDCRILLGDLFPSPIEPPPPGRKPQLTASHYHCRLLS